MATFASPSLSDDPSLTNYRQIAQRNRSLMQQQFRQARRMGDFKGARAVAQEGDAMGLPIGRTANVAEIRNAGETDYLRDHAIAGTQPPVSGLDAYDNRHSSASGVGVGGYDFRQSSDRRKNPYKLDVPGMEGSLPSIPKRYDETSPAMEGYTERPGDIIRPDGSGYSRTMDYKPGYDRGTSVDLSRPLQRPGFTGWDKGKEPVTGASIGDGAEAYSFDQQHSPEGQQGFSPRGPVQDSVVNEFRDRWRAARAAGDQNAADDIIAEGKAAGVPLSGAGLQRFAIRRQQLSQGLRREPSPAPVGQAGPSGPAGQPAASLVTRNDIASMNVGVDAANTYLSPEASAARDADRAKMLQPKEDEWLAAKQRTLDIKAISDALPEPSAGYRERFAGTDGGIDMGKVDAYAGRQLADLNGIDARNREGLAGAIGRMRAEKDLETIRIENSPGKTYDWRKPGPTPLQDAETTWQRLAPGRSIPDMTKEGHAAIDAAKEPAPDYQMGNIRTAGNWMMDKLRPIKKWIDSDARRPYSPTGSTQLKNSLRR